MSHDDKPFSLPADQIHIPAGSMWRKMPIIGAVIAAAGLGGAYATMQGDTHAFWYAYLVGYMVFLALGLGGLFFTILQHLVRAGWSIAVRRIAENAMIDHPPGDGPPRPADHLPRRPRPLPLDRCRRGRA